MKLAEGAKSLSDGSKSLYDGTKALADGTKELDDGVSDMTKEMDDVDVDGIIKRFKNVITSGENYDNFSGKSDDTKSSVKFIIKTDKVSAD